MEIDVYRPGSVAAVSPSEGHGSHPHGALTELGGAIAATTTITASDLGYRTAPADGPVVVYPPVLDGAFAIDRRIELDPGASAISETWGSVTLLNPNGLFDAIAGADNSDTRGLRILAGRKILDTTRNIYLDPGYSALTTVFSGLAQVWALTEANLTVPIADPAYWLQVPLQAALYGGTGGLDGTAALTGTAKPKARGGTATAPIRNVTPVMVDPVNLIYQYSDAAGTVVTLYEGGDGANITRATDVANLYSGSTPAGQYRTCNALGLFQLGTTPASGRIITADVTGQFPSAGVVTSPVAIARQLILEDAVVPSAYLDLAAWSAVDTAWPATAGVWFGSNSTVTADVAVSAVLGSIGARVMASRLGLLRPFLIRALAAGVAPTFSFNVDNTIDVQRIALPTNIDPPTAVWKVGYQHNYTTQTSGLSPSATSAQVAYVAQSDTMAAWASTAVLAAYRRPNFPDPVTGALLTLTDAQNMANAFGALWGVRRRLYTVQVPLALALSVDLGAVVSLAWPAEDLAAGQIGQIVGEQTRTLDDPTVTFLVLI